MGRLVDIARAAAAVEGVQAAAESTKETKEALRSPVISFISCAGQPGETGGQRLARLPLREFARSGLWAVVWSATLAQRVVFAADNAALPTDLRMPVYRAAELLELVKARPTAVTLRLIHEAKATFRGRLATQALNQDAVTKGDA